MATRRFAIATARTGQRALAASGKADIQTKSKTSNANQVKMLSVVVAAVSRLFEL